MQFTTLRLQTLTVLCILQLLNPPISNSFVIASTPTASHRRQWGLLRSTPSPAADDEQLLDVGTTTEAEDDDEANAFERVVRTVSKNKQYKFGDLTKKTVSATTKVGYFFTTALHCSLMIPFQPVHG
jgi:hypothetical protein